MGLVMVAELLGHGATAERARQVEQRAIRKVVIASELIGVIDQARMMVAAGAHFVIVYPSSTDTSLVTIALSIETSCNTMFVRCAVANALMHRMVSELTFPDGTSIKSNGLGSIIVQCAVDR